MALKEEDILEEVFKIIDSNKSKASSLRNSILNVNQNIYNNNLHIQIIQYLGEFEYDLKTLIELLQEFQNKSKRTFQNKITALKKELNNIKKENTSLKYIQDNKTKNKYKNKLHTSENKITKKTDKKNEKKITQISDNPNKNLKISSQNNFYTNKARIIDVNKTNNKNNNNINNISNNFCDYNSFISNIKRNNSKKNNIIKYELYKKNNKKDINDIARGRMNNSVRTQSANSKIIYKNKNLNRNEEKKEKIINEIFQDERILNALKKQFGNEIEDKLLNDDINMEFLLKVEEISDRIKRSYFNKKIENGLVVEDSNKSFNLKIPKRYSNIKSNNSLNNLIITS